RRRPPGAGRQQACARPRHQPGQQRRGLLRRGRTDRAISQLGETYDRGPRRSRPLSDALSRSVEKLLSHAAALDADKRWDEWLELFAPDVEFWMPSWDSDTELTQDPDNELSLIYYSGRFGLEDRVFRLRTHTSAASEPPARTTHYVTNVLTEFLPDGSCK